MKNRYYLLYGYDRDIFINVFTNQIKDDPLNKIIIIEPRGLYIEEFKKEFKTSNQIILESKFLTNDRLKYKYDLFKKNEIYSIDVIDNYQKKETVFSVTLTSMIEKYDIQNIQKFIINLNVIEINTLLSEFFMYQHFISKVQIEKNIQFDVKENYLRTDENETFVYYENRNLEIDLPSICLYTIDFPSSHINKNKLNQMIKQYDIEVLNNGELIPVDEIDEKLNLISNKEKFNIRHIPDKIESIIQKKYYDIIIQFNTKYFDLKPFFQLMYPLKDNILYMNKGLDIIYGNGKTMYKMYEIMYSMEFKEYMRKKREEKPKLYIFFEKRYFYDFITNKFKILEIN